MRRHVLLGALAALTYAAPAAASGGAYSFVDLGTLGGSFSNALAINSSGQVAGGSWLPGDTGETHAVLWGGGSLIDLGTFGGGPTSSASAINDAGVVGGGSATAGYAASLPILWKPGATPLPTLGGNVGSVIGMNTAGLAVGFSSNASGTYVATTWTAGVATGIGPLDGRQSVAMSVNALGQVVGAIASPSSNGAIGTLQPIAWQGASWNALVLPAFATGGYAAAVNDSGLAAGYTHTGNPDDGESAVLWSLATLQPLVLPRLGGSYARANGVNSAGDVVGYSATTSGDQHAFLWQSGALIDINGLVDESVAGWTLVAANAINDKGQIVGFASNALGQQHAYLLSPIAAVPEPNGLGLLLLGLPVICLRMAAKRRVSDDETQTSQRA